MVINKTEYSNKQRKKISTTTPFISIITINYNNAEGLKKTINSVKSQTNRNFEHIIIDGGSTDNSTKIIQEYVKSKEGTNISYWCSEKDSGIYNAMNKGINQAKGKYCLFLNSGDWLFNNDVLEIAQKTNYKEEIIYYDCILSFPYREKKIVFPDIIDADFFYHRHTLSHQNTLIKTKLQKNNLYHEDYNIASDVVFFIESIIEQKVSFRHVHNVLAYFDASDGLSTNLKNKKKNDLDWLKIRYTYFTDKLNYDYNLFLDYETGYWGILRKLRFFFNKISLLTFRRKDKSHESNTTK